MENIPASKYGTSTMVRDSAAQNVHMEYIMQNSLAAAILEHARK